MRCNILSVIKKQLWLLKAVDRSTRTTAAWVLGNCDTTTFRRLYAKVTYLKQCTFYTDNWGTFSKVLPADRHIIEKAHTHTIAVLFCIKYFMQGALHKILNTK